MLMMLIMVMMIMMKVSDNINDGISSEESYLVMKVIIEVWRCLL